MATVTLLQLKSTFYGHADDLFTGTATGGSTLKLTDSQFKGASADDPWPVLGKQLRITSGSASGDLRRITKLDTTEGDLFPQRDFSAAVANTNTYEVWGAFINGGQALTHLFNRAIKPLRPVAETQITIVTNQRVYDVSSHVQTKRDIRDVYVRHLDSASVEPYYRRSLLFDAVDRGGAGTPAVSLEITPLTRDDTAIELWLRHEARFSAFSTDSDTVDEVYREWLAAEALYLLCTERLGQGGGDFQRWRTLRGIAEDLVESWRARWMPREPIEVSPWP